MTKEPLACATVPPPGGTRGRTVSIEQLRLALSALSILITTFREGREHNIALDVWRAAFGSGGGHPRPCVPVHEEIVIFELARADVMDVNATGEDKLTEGRVRGRHRPLDFAPRRSRSSGRWSSMRGECVEVIRQSAPSTGSSSLPASAQRRAGRAPAIPRTSRS